MKRGNLAKSEQIRKNKQKKLPNQDRFSPEFHNLILLLLKGVLFGV